MNIDTEKHPSVEEIRLKQYSSFRYNFNKYLIIPILGEKYYNYGHDTYQCDHLTCKDILNKFKELEQEVRVYKWITFLLSLALALSFLLKI